MGVCKSGLGAGVGVGGEGQGEECSASGLVGIVGDRLSIVRMCLWQRVAFGVGRCGGGWGSGLNLLCNIGGALVSCCST